MEKGDVLLGCPGGRWHEVKVTRLNADGTVNAQPTHSDSFLDAWESISRAELSPDDKALWTAQYARFKGDAFDRSAMHRAINSFGDIFPDEQMEQYWTAVTGELFGATPDTAPALTLDEAQAYKLIVRSGYSAKKFADPKPDIPDLFRLYWNGCRMGGRNENEAPAVTLADVLRAYSLDGEDPNLTTALLRFEHAHGIKVPPTLAELFTRTDCLAKIMNGHCNNPEPQSPAAWEIHRDLPAHFGGALGVRIMLPHQGDHAWWAVFNEGDADARIAISFEEGAPPVRLQARSLPFFFWDLRQGGKNWEEAIAERNGDDESTQAPAKKKAPTKKAASKPKAAAKLKAPAKAKAKPAAKLKAPAKAKAKPAAKLKAPAKAKARSATMTKAKSASKTKPSAKAKKVTAKKSKRKKSKRK